MAKRLCTCTSKKNKIGLEHLPNVLLVLTLDFVGALDTVVSFTRVSRVLHAFCVARDLKWTHIERCWEWTEERTAGARMVSLEGYGAIHSPKAPKHFFASSAKILRIATRSGLRESDMDSFRFVLPLVRVCSLETLVFQHSESSQHNDWRRFALASLADFICNNPGIRDLVVSASVFPDDFSANTGFLRRIMAKSSIGCITLTLDLLNSSLNTTMTSFNLIRMTDVASASQCGFHDYPGLRLCVSDRELLGDRIDIDSAVMRALWDDQIYEDTLKMFL